VLGRKQKSKENINKSRRVQEEKEEKLNKSQITQKKDKEERKEKPSLNRVIGRS